MFDAVMVRLKRMLFSGIRSAVIFGIIGAAVRITQLFSAYKLVSTVLIYLAICEIVLTGTQFLVSYVQLKEKVKEEQKHEK